MSRVLEYKVEESIDLVNNWMKYIKKKGEQIDKGEDEVSKEVKGKNEVNLVQKCTRKTNCEVRCKVHDYVGHTL